MNIHHMTQRTFSIFLLLLVGVSASQCNKKIKETASTEATPEKADRTGEGFSKGTVVDMNGKLDGCGWLIQLEDSTKLEPMNLSETFRKDQLKVWVKYSINTTAASICMAGKIVNITAIEER